MRQINTIVRLTISCWVVVIASFASLSAWATEKEGPVATDENWVASDNELLSLRIFAEKPRVARGESIRVVAQLRNEGEKPLTVIRPYGDPYKAQASQPGGEKSGRYALRFDYSYFGEGAAFAEKQGVKNAWHGWISSREIQVERE